MTLIVQPGTIYGSKAMLKAALDKGDAQLHEPSIMGSWTKLSKDLPVGFKDTCTRMQRDKFCTIRKKDDGTWEVK